MAGDSLTGLIETMTNLLLSTYRRTMQPLPHRMDEQLAEAVEAVWSAGPDVRQNLPRMISEAGARVGRSYPVNLLRAFSERMANLAVRTKSERWIRVGLAALTLDDFEEEWRESLLIVPLHYRAAEIVGADPASLFEGVATEATDGAAKVLRSFVRRAPEDRSIQAMGYEERTTEEGFEFHRTW